jgi:RNA polymerase sigma factor (sigma-70 family)
MPRTQLDGVLRHLRRVTGPAAPELTDAQLLERYAGRRDEDAFAALVRRYGRLVRSVCWRVLHQPQDTDDAFQATFLVFATKATSIRKTAALASWLYGVAFRTAMNAKRARTRRTKETRVPDRTPSQPAAEAGLREVQRILDEELNRLPEKYRAPFVMCCLCGKSKGEAARELGWKEGTVSCRVARARRELQKRLTRRGVSLTAALCGVELSRAAAAAVPAALVKPTIQAALSFAAGKSAAADLVSAPVAALAKGVLQGMWTAKLKFATAVLLAAGCALGAGWLACRALAAEPGDTPRQAPAQKSSPGPKAPAATKPADARKAESEAVVIQGRVLDPEGKPCRGAKVYLWTPGPKKTDGGAERARTGADGRFRFTASKAELARHAKVVVLAKGHGPDWKDVEASARTADLTLHLAKDDVPIDGRILDLEGTPVAGVTVEIARLEQGDLNAWFEARKKGYSGNLMRREIAAEALHRPTRVTTAKDGRVRLTGFGRDRVVLVRLRGEPIEHCVFWVVTRDDALRGFRVGPYGTYGARFTHFARPSKPIIGTVRDKATGKPLAGIDVVSSYYNNHWTKTDAKGRYRIVGTGKYEQYSVSAGGPPYFNCTKMNIADTPGLNPLRVDFALERGIAVRGRLTGKATGKPVAGHVGYVPLADNPNLKNFSDLGKPQILAADWGRAKPDGSFTVTAIPGPGLLLARADDDTRYLVAEPVGIKAASNIILQGTYHALITINPSDKDPRSTTRDIALVAGKTVTGTVLGPDGRPLAGARAAGLSGIVQFSFGREPEKLPTASFTAGGLDPQKPRALVFIHPEKKLAKVQHPRGSEAGPLQVRLEPLGALAGRILDAAGKPLPGVSVTIMLSYRPEDYKGLPYDLLIDRQTWGKVTDVTATTDAGGQFRARGLVPGLKYMLRVKRGAQFLPFAREDLAVESGKTKDLGDLREQAPAGKKGKKWP